MAKQYRTIEELHARAGVEPGVRYRVTVRDERQSDGRFTANTKSSRLMEIEVDRAIGMMKRGEIESFTVDVIKEAKP